MSDNNKQKSEEDQDEDQDLDENALLDKLDSFEAVTEKFQSLFANLSMTIQILSDRLGSLEEKIDAIEGLDEEEE